MASGSGRRFAFSIGAVALAVASCSSGASGPAEPAPSSASGSGPTPTTVAAAAVAAKPSTGCTSTPPAPVKAGEIRVDITSGGGDRWYLRQVPPSYTAAKPMPLVIDLHGYTVGAQLETTATGLGAYGDEHGFLTVTPQGSGDPRFITWDTALRSADVTFIGALIYDVERTLCVDRRRVFVTGYSQGAFMTSTLACAYADRIAAVAPVAGIRDTPGCRPARPVPVVAFHGTADAEIAFTGGLGPAALKLPAPDASGKTMGDEGLQLAPPLNGAAIPTITTNWALRNGCKRAPTAHAVAADVTRFTWPCKTDRAVELYRITAGGHTWPGSAFTKAAAAILGRTTMSISADQIIWRFFEEHPLRT